MRFLSAGLVGLALLAPARADDKKADDKSAPAPKTAADKFKDLEAGYMKELEPLSKEFEKAKTPEERTKIQDKAFVEIAGDYSKKMMALAAENPKDPAAEKALVWVCTRGYRTPQVPAALGLLLKNYPGSEMLSAVCQGLQHRPGGEALLRDLRAQATNKKVKLQAGLALAGALRNENDEKLSAEAEKLFQEAVTEAKAVGAPEQVVKQIEESLKDLRKFGVGKPAPAAESKDLDDKKVSLADLKGKVVVLDFWATWCGPCKGMIPHERAMVKKNAGKPFALVSVSADEKVTTLKEFLEKESMPWTHWFAGQGGEVLRDWNISGFPTLFVIDAKGVIRGKFVGVAPDTEKKLDDLVEKCVKEAG
jgi:thiol-disulfide isomerase/thioredoxin